MFRFVVVPAIPKEKESWRCGNRVLCSTASIGFSIYDNEEKCRLSTEYSSRATADEKCERLNAPFLQAGLDEGNLFSQS